MENEQTNSKILKDQYIPTAEFYSQVVDSLQDYSIFTLDKDLIINSWNSGSSSIFGYETEEVIGKHFDIIFTEEDKKNGVPNFEINVALKEGRASDNRWQIRKDGSRFYAYGLIFPLTGIDGELLGYTKILRDLTERRKSDDAIKKYVKDLEELNTHKESILAILSHDLRSPLARVIETAEYLKMYYDEMECSEVKQMIDHLHKSSIDELNMLDYLIRWARIRCASEAFSPSKIELSQNVDKVFETLYETATINRISLYNDVEIPTNVFADSKMLHSILRNIISNALKHTLPGGKITVTSIKKEDKIIVEINDTGIGMSKEMKEKLFVPQMDTLSNAIKDNKGAGIGLILVKGFLEKNGGEIWVESSEGVGSSFYFTLPADNPSDKTAGENNPEIS